MDVSHSDMQLFKRCRQRWDLTSPNRMSLSPPGAPATALWLGSVFHEGMAIVGMGNDLQPMLDEWVDSEVTKMAQAYAKVIGSGWGPDEEERVDESIRHALLYLDLYLDFYPELFPGFEILAVEQPFKIPVPYQRGRFYVGTWDMIIRDLRNEVCWVVDHKTFSQTPNPEFILNQNEQFSGYAWAFMRLFPNDKFGGCIYDGVYKGLPSEPQVLQNGTMSQRWIKTTAGLYKKRLIEAGFDPENYEDFLQRLRERDKSPENPFFKRLSIPADRGEIMSWERSMRLLVRDMFSYPSKRPYLYPNRRWEGCWDCAKPVRQVCGALHSRVDPDDTSEADNILRLWQKTVPPTQKKVRTLKPKTVRSVDELKEFIASTLE